MEVRIECTDGDTSRFTIANEAYSRHLIDSIRPSELFRQPLLRIQSGKRTNIFVINAIESIHFVTPLKTDLRGQPPAKELQTISKEEYEEKLRNLCGRYETPEDPFKPGANIDTLLAIDCVSGRTHYLEADIVVGHRLEQIMDMRSRLERLTAMIPCSPEGYLAINPHNIKRIGIYPAPELSARGGWLVD